MKKSIYTILIPYKHTFIAYNTLWNSSLLVHKKDLHIWGLGDGINLNTLDSRIVKILKEKKIIIDSNIDELQIIKSKLDETNSTPNTFEITIIPTLACNFSCWYCYENHNTPIKITKQEIKNIIDMLCLKVRQNKEIKNIKFQFFGGEPLICYNSVIRPLIEDYYKNIELQKIFLNIGITTNGYLLNSEMINYFKNLNISAFL